MAIQRIIIMKSLNCFSSIICTRKRMRAGAEEEEEESEKLSEEETEERTNLLGGLALGSAFMPNVS